MKIKKYIHVDKETREFLCKAMNVEPRTVFNALNFVKDNDLAKRIRNLAYSKGGILMNELPAIETLHDAGNYMRQYMPNGVLLEFSKTDGGGDVYLRGRLVRHYDRVMCSEIGGIQDWAATLR